jgi:polysaccharide export outer membrane protein
MNTTLHRKLGRITSLRVLVWMLAVLMVAPPPVLAQIFGGSSTQQQQPGMMPSGGAFPGVGAFPGGGQLPGGSTAAPTGQPIMTNPSALQPIVPSQTPCPLPPLEQEMFPPQPPFQQMPQPGGIVQVQAGGGGQQPSQLQPGMGTPSGQIGIPFGQQQGFGGQIYPQQGFAGQAYPQQGFAGQGYPPPTFGSPFSPLGMGALGGQTAPPLVGGQLAPPGFAPGGIGQPGIGGQLSPGSGIPSMGLGGAPPGMQGERPGSALQQPGDPLSQISAGLLGQAELEVVDEVPIEQGLARFLYLQGMTGRLKQFGYNFFDVQFSGLPLVMDVPVGPDYVLGPDDTLALHIWNVPDPNLNKSFISPVERDGTIFLPQVGSIPVAGTTFSQATRLIHGRLSSHLKRFELHVSMARLRTIKVYVVGEVIRPGAYEVSSLATVSHALYAACGPAKSGSLRSIRLVRNGQTMQELDFYQFLLKGDRTQDLRLQSGDTVLVPPIGAAAAIGGQVKRPAIYELKDRTTLTGLIDIAGGLKATAGLRKCQIFRVEPGKQRVVIDADLGSLLERPMPVKEDGQRAKPDSIEDPIIQDGDFVRIASLPSQVENAVSLIGAVRDSGLYEFHPGMRLKDLLTSEQMLTDSYWDRAELIRTDPVTYETTVIAFSPKALFQASESANLELHRLDKVVVATQVKPPRLVTVQGEIKRPGTYTIETGERLSSVLKRAGGLTLRAYPQGILLFRQSVRRTQQTDVEKFVALQKQKLIAETASYSAGGSGLGYGSQEVATLQIQLQALDQLAFRVQPGRVVIKMKSLEELEGSLEDLGLEEGDYLIMPQRPTTVTIVGAVRMPTSLVYQEGFGLDDYVRQVGGMTSDADKKGMYLLRADGSVEASYAKFKVIAPGDSIVVPQSTEPKIRAIPFWQSMAVILTGLAAAATAAMAIVLVGRQ